MLAYFDRDGCPLEIVKEEPDDLALDLTDGNLTSCVPYTNTTANKTVYKIWKDTKDYLLSVLLYGQISCSMADGTSFLVYAGRQQCIYDSSKCSSQKLVLCSFVRQVALDEANLAVCEYVCECFSQSCDCIAVMIPIPADSGQSIQQLCELRF